MRVRIVDLLADAVLTDVLVESRAASRVMRERVFVKRRFKVDQTLWQGWIEDKIQLPTLQDSLDRTEEKYLIFPDRPANIRGRIPAVEERRSFRCIRNIVRVKCRTP